MAVSKKRSRKRWWRVYGEASTEFESKRFIGEYFDTLERLAFGLYHKRGGWWCDGSLSFMPIRKPTPPPKLKKNEDGTAIRIHFLDAAGNKLAYRDDADALKQEVKRMSSRYSVNGNILFRRKA